MAGFKVDLQELERVAKEFENEKAEIEERLQKKVRELMDDTPINLRSPARSRKLLLTQSTTKKNGQTYLTSPIQKKSSRLPLRKTQTYLQDTGIHLP